MVEIPRLLIDLAHRNLVHPLLTRGEADREIAHERALQLMEQTQQNPLAMAYFSRFFTLRDPILVTPIRTREGFTQYAPNPFGIAAGFDKDARVTTFLGNGLGFGIVTVGSITAVPYEGNPRPRIFDLPNNDGLINRMGFPGEGTKIGKSGLKKSHIRGQNYILKINVAASKPSFERGTYIKDYGQAFEDLLVFANTMEINISSPNTEGTRELQEPEAFEELASHIAERRKQSPLNFIPLIYKFSPDLSPQHLERVLRIAIDRGADGVTLTNTSTDPTLRHSLMPDRYKDESGGMSGAFLGHRALETTHRAYKYVGEEIFIIRAGGVRGTASDLWEALTYGGATAAEVYTSFVRLNTSTPNFTVYALKGLAKAMRAEGMTSMEDFKSLRGKRVPFPFLLLS